MNRTAVVAVCLALLTGCHKKTVATNTAPPPSTESTQAVTTAGPPAPTPLADIPPPATPTPEPDLNFLSMRLRDWIFANGRTPKNFDEFAATAHMQIPPPPAGKKYAFTQRMRVILVDR